MQGIDQRHPESKCNLQYEWLSIVIHETKDD